MGDCLKTPSYYQRYKSSGSGRYEDTRNKTTFSLSDADSPLRAIHSAGTGSLTVALHKVDFLSASEQKKIKEAYIKKYEEQYKGKDKIKERTKAIEKAKKSFRLCSLNDSQDIRDTLWATVDGLTSEYTENGTTFTHKVFGNPYSQNDAMVIHRYLVAPLNSFIVTLDYFARVYGGYGTLKVIGMDRSLRTVKRDSPSFHYRAKALDIWWLGWEKKDKKTGAAVHTAARPCNGQGEVDSGIAAYRRLVAVEAAMRKWFGIVLNRKFSSHDNHLHVEIGCPIALRAATGTRTGHKNAHYFLRDCIRAFTDESVEYTGTWDYKADHGYKTLLSDLGLECLDPVKDVAHYMLFLDYIMMHGFADKQAGAYRWGDSAII